MTGNSRLASLHLPDDLSSSYRNLLKRLRDGRVIERIWERDYTVWRPEPAEIENRLGWLDLPDTFRKRVLALPEELRFAMDGSIQDLVLLGMGGSSLCPLVLSECVGARMGHPKLHVLDTTVPSTLEKVTKGVDLSKTLFLVSSKSGGTIEVASGFEYFFDAVSKISLRPGAQFIAITDPGTGLAQLAEERGFATIFENPADIGGRFSALSYFGMVPAALLGLDLEKIFDRAADLAEACRSEDPGENPGAQLGAFLAACYDNGRDKLTLQTSPGYDTVGLWIEQLLAESTGKEEKGILPLAQEPRVGPWAYGNDRAFAVLKSKDDDFLSGWIRGLEKNGYPVVAIEINDPLALGAEFFRWEFATAVVSHFLDIHPYDQPNVEESKKLSRAILGDPSLTEPDSLSLAELLEGIKLGDYFAILAYLDEAPDTHRALAELREAVLKSKKVATTLGYGPRYLHSTGQYHKGGPNTGVFLQIVEEDPTDVPIPSKDYGFAKLCAAQALGDFQALTQRGRRVARVKVGKNPAAEIGALASKV
jgi:glucose-6-phosphate isomerase/transaldolase/glucose-6-phosphate isomerase